MLPTLSEIEPGDAVVVFVVVEYVFVTFPAHPECESLHVHVIVLFDAVHVVLPPLFVHVGAVLSI